jgi:hypothetical protein
LITWTLRPTALCVPVPLGSAEPAYYKRGIHCLPCEDEPVWHFVTLLWERGACCADMQLPYRPDQCRPLEPATAAGLPLW